MVGCVHPARAHEGSRAARTRPHRGGRRSARCERGRLGPAETRTASVRAYRARASVVPRPRGCRSDPAPIGRRGCRKHSVIVRKSLCKRPPRPVGRASRNVTGAEDVRRLSARLGRCITVCAVYGVARGVPERRWYSVWDHQTDGDGATQRAGGVLDPCWILVNLSAQRHAIVIV